MYIDEIEKGTRVRIYYKDMTLETRIKAVRRENIRFAMLEQVMFEDKVLSFRANEIELEYDVPSGGVIRFKAEQVGNIVFKEEPYLIFVCNEDMGLYNRRSEYRSEFSTEAQIQLGSNTKVYDCYIHDISRSGINIKIRLVDKPKTVVGTEVSINFYYEKFDRNYRLKGVIKRIYFDELFTSYGILLEDVPQAWLSLVNVTERKSLKLRADSKNRKNDKKTS